MTGYSRPEVLGKNTRILKSGKQDAAFYAGLWATILAGQVWRGEMINCRKDGSLYTEKMSITPVHNKHGELTHMVAMKEDITARKLLENQFRQTQKMEAVGRLAAGVAHDFNNLLTIIIGYSDLMLEQFVAGDPRRAYLTEVRSAGERAVGLTRQLLAFSRQQVLAPQVLDLNTLVANLTKMLKRLIGEDIDLVFNPQSSTATVKADPGHIEQVLMNLAVNARDAMPRGGRLTIGTSQVQVDEAYNTTHFSIPTGPYIMLAVSDTGCGMDKDTQAHMFEPFFTTKAPGSGTGLGLATVYGIVQQSGGYIYVYSEPGAGATFKIYLPIIMGEPEEAKDRVVPAGGSEAILLVEDDAGLRELARMVLEARGGYKVLESSGCKEARRFAAQHQGPIHLMLTDVVMPEINGRELSEELAAVRPEMKILYMSGYTDDTVVRHGVLEERMAFLQKPFTADSLLRKVRDVLDTRSPV
jgi:PAS domain S-box-containing protein